MKTARYEIYQDRARLFRWRLRAANNEIVASGEAYTTKRSALRGIEAHKRAATTTVIHDETSN